MKARLFPFPVALSLVASLALSPLAGAASIEKSTITQVVNDVSIIEAKSKARHPAELNGLFKVPDLLRTGANSRAEMIAPDQTVTRVGANTLFAFEENSREINLQQGSVLFHSPTGKGGGTIRTAAATAAVLGTTLIVVTTKNGGFKALLLEGHGEIKTSKGHSRWLKAGQMVYALPGGDLSQVLNFQLAEQVGASMLVKGFPKPLASLPKIQTAIGEQNRAFEKGRLVRTGMLASDRPDKVFGPPDPNSTTALRESQEDNVQRAQASVSSDAFIRRPDLEPMRLFQPLDPRQAIGQLFPGANLPKGFDHLTLFLARNTVVETPKIDLGPFGPGAFLFVSSHDFVVRRPVEIFGGRLGVIGIVASGAVHLERDASLFLDAPKAFVFSLGGDLKDLGSMDNLGRGSPVSLTASTIASSGGLALFAGSFDLTNSQLAADRGDLLVRTPGNFTADGDPAHPYRGGNGQLQVLGDGRLELLAGGDIFQSNGTTDATSVTYKAAGRITESTVRNYANTVSFNSGGRMILNGALFAANSALAPASSVSLTAGRGMLLNNVAFQSANVALDARTLVLRNVAFVAGSSVTMRSATGQLASGPNTNQPIQSGKVNFIQNVRYGGKPAQNAIGTGIKLTK